MHPQALEISRIALSLRDVRFVHQGRTREHGLDCVGLVRFPAIELGLLPELNNDYRGYGRDPDPAFMGQKLEEFLVPWQRGKQEIGDIVWCHGTSSNVPRHLALVCQNEKGHTVLVHASMERMRVVSHGFRHPWPRLVHRVFRYPEHG